MVCGRRQNALLVLVLPAVWLAVSGCAGDGPESAPPTTTEQETPPPRTPAPPPPTEIRVVDGDSSKPVARARVTVAGQTSTSGRGGVALLDLGSTDRAEVRVSARGYGQRSVRVNFREQPAPEIAVWRPALQWTMYGVNLARTQVHPDIKLRPPFRVVWQRDLRRLLEFPAVVWNGVAYVSNLRGRLFALSMKNGHILWRQPVGTRMASSPGLDAKRGILVTTTMEPGDVKVVSMKDGRVRWHFHTGRSEPSPLIRDGVAYLGAANGNVYALDLDRRRPRWTFHGGVKITSSPALVGNRLYFGDYAGRVFALNARTGRVVWRGSAGSRVYGTVAVAGGRVFAPSVFSGLSALSARTGRLLWRIPVGAYLYSSPAAFRGRVYFGTYAGFVYCADGRSGRILWRRPSGGRVSGAVEVVGDVVYAGSLEHRITAWHWRSGRTLWSFPHGKYVPVSGNGARLLLHDSHVIYAVEPKKRKKRS
jgi:outer membrane protein assembly factor BamB